MWKTALRWLLTLAMVGSGTLHFLRPAPFLAIMPAYLPAPLLLVQISGACEVAGGIGLAIPALRRFAAWGLIALLVAVFPANINQAVNHISFTAEPISPIILWARLPLQALLIWVAWLSTRKEAPARS